MQPSVCASSLLDSIRTLHLAHQVCGQHIFKSRRNGKQGFAHSLHSLRARLYRAHARPHIHSIEQLVEDQQGYDLPDLFSECG